MKAISPTRGLGEPALKVWRLDQAALQASAHRTSHAGLENDAMCAGGGGSRWADPSPAPVAIREQPQLQDRLLPLLTAR